MVILRQKEYGKNSLRYQKKQGKMIAKYQDKAFKIGMTCGNTDEAVMEAEKLSDKLYKKAAQARKRWKAQVSATGKKKGQHRVRKILKTAFK